MSKSTAAHLSRTFSRYPRRMQRDLRYALRVLARNRGFTATAIAALALGIGASSAMVSVLYGVLLKPLPYREPRRLVRIYQNNPVERFAKFPLSPADFIDYRRLNRVFESMAAYVRQDKQYGGERPERLIGLRISDEFFHVLGTPPMLGRTFTRQEVSTRADVAVISHDVWARLLDRDAHVIGRRIELSGDLFTIVGVMPAGFADVSGGYRMPTNESVQVWLPFDLLGRRDPPRAFHYCNTIARLRPGVTPEQANAQLNVVAARLGKQYADDRDWRIQLAPMQDDLTGKARPTLMILAG